MSGNEIVVMQSIEGITTSQSLPENFNLDLVRNIVHERENPHPMNVAMIAVCVVLTIYILYIIFIKRDVSGYWYGKLGDFPNMILYRINHNKFTDSVSVHIKDLSGGLIPIAH